MGIGCDLEDDPPICRGEIGGVEAGESVWGSKRPNNPMAPSPADAFDRFLKVSESSDDDGEKVPLDFEEDNDFRVEMSFFLLSCSKSESSGAVDPSCILPTERFTAECFMSMFNRLRKGASPNVVRREAQGGDKLP